MLLPEMINDYYRKVTCHSIPLLVVLLSVPSQTTAQRVISSMEFFGIGMEEVMGTTGSRQGKAPPMPWFEEYQFRTETRDFDVERQEYTFRMAPSTGRKRRALTALYNHQESAPDFEALESQCDALADRYDSWLELYLMDQELTILTKLRIVLDDRQTVLNRQAGSLDFDWSKLVKLRQDVTDLDLRFSRLNTEVARINNSMGLVEPSFSFTGFITLSQIGASFPGAFKLTNDPKSDYELETVARELELEKAEQKQYFDFAQVKYQGPHSDLPRERLSIGLAFQLPNSGGKLVKIRELELEEETLRREQAAAVEAEKVGYEADMAAWLIDYGHFNFMISAHLREKEELIRIGSQLKKKEGFSPLPLLEIEERALRNELRLLDLSASLYQKYLKIREGAGELCSAVNGELLLQ
ncbi:hypothetical protein [Neolewinella persica]|uniref:hypothetical protein n=1 Tax=Neolewinella persica TaxID=70998 RepID=UPI00039C8526|nr:hypothetical protein [Neolewinella persica]